MSSDEIIARPGNTSGQVPEAKPSRRERLYGIRYRLLFGGLILVTGGVIFSLNMLGGCLELTQDSFSGDLVASSCDSGVLATLPEWVAVPLLMLSHIAILAGTVMAALGLGAIALGGNTRARNGQNPAWVHRRRLLLIGSTFLMAGLVLTFWLAWSFLNGCSAGPPPWDTENPTAASPGDSHRC